MNTNTDLAYTAGIIDGEGCIRLQPKTFGLDISVGNTDLNLLLWLRDHWGGKIYPNRSCSPERNAKPFYHWRLNGKTGFPFLETILPYMVVKAERARKALELREFYCRQNRYQPGFNQHCQSQRRRIYEELKQMNRRGHAERTF